MYKNRLGIVENKEYTTKADRFNELKGKEMKIEIPLSLAVDIDELAKNIFLSLNDNIESRFEIAKSMPEIVESNTRQLRYATINEAGKENKLFTINIQPQGGIITIKKKSGSEIVGRAMIRDEQEYQLPYKEWDTEKEKDVIEEQAKIFGLSSDQIRQTRSTEKRKLKIRVEDKQTKRIFTVGVTTKVRKDKTSKNFVSIEYVGTEVDGEVSQNAEDVTEKIFTELEELKNRVMSVCGGLEVKASGLRK